MICIKKSTVSQHPFARRWYFTNIHTKSDVTTVTLCGKPILKYDGNTKYISFPVFDTANHMSMVYDETKFDSWIIAVFHTIQDFLETLGWRLDYSDGRISKLDWCVNHHNIHNKTNRKYCDGRDVLKTWTVLYDMEKPSDARIYGMARRKRSSARPVAPIKAAVFEPSDDDFPAMESPTSSKCSDVDEDMFQLCMKFINDFPASDGDPDIDVEELIRLCTTFM